MGIFLLKNFLPQLCMFQMISASWRSFCGMYVGVPTDPPLGSRIRTGRPPRWARSRRTLASAPPCRAARPVSASLPFMSHHSVAMDGGPTPAGTPDCGTPPLPTPHGHFGALLDHEVPNPFVNEYKWTPCNILKAVLCGLTLTWIRVLVLLLLVLFILLFAPLANLMACVTKADPEKRLPCAVRAMLTPIRWALRGVLWCFGFWWIPVKDLRADKKKKVCACLRLCGARLGHKTWHPLPTGKEAFSDAHQPRQTSSTLHTTMEHAVCLCGGEHRIPPSLRPKGVSLAECLHNHRLNRRTPPPPPATPPPPPMGGTVTLTKKHGKH